MDVDNGLFHSVDDGQDVGSSEQCAALQDSADECLLVIGAYVVDLCSIVAFGACERVLGYSTISSDCLRGYYCFMNAAESRSVL